MKFYRNQGDTIFDELHERMKFYRNQEDTIFDEESTEGNNDGSSFAEQCGSDFFQRLRGQQKEFDSQIQADENNFNVEVTNEVDSFVNQRKSEIFEQAHHKGVHEMFRTSFHPFMRSGGSLTFRSALGDDFRKVTKDSPEATQSEESNPQDHHSSFEGMQIAKQLSCSGSALY
eukprot:m.196561 g.196561  ORF g.196561 m.196561 type:complete len:173 (+) comp39532_c1_seq15:2-520(+)